MQRQSFALLLLFFVFVDVITSQVCSSDTKSGRVFNITIRNSLPNQELASVYLINSDCIPVFVITIPNKAQLVQTSAMQFVWLIVHNSSGVILDRFIASNNETNYNVTGTMPGFGEKLALPGSHTASIAATMSATLAPTIPSSSTSMIVPTSFASAYGDNPTKSTQSIQNLGTSTSSSPISSKGSTTDSGSHLKLIIGGMAILFIVSVTITSIAVYISRNNINLCRMDSWDTRDNWRLNDVNDELTNERIEFSGPRPHSSLYGPFSSGPKSPTDIRMSNAQEKGLEASLQENTYPNTIRHQFYEGFDQRTLTIPQSTPLLHIQK